MKEYNIDPYYLEQLELKTIERPLVDSSHNDPATFNLTQDQAKEMKMTFLRAQKRDVMKLVKKHKLDWVKNPNEVSEMLYNDAKKSLDKIDREIYYRNNQTKGNDFDIIKLKTIPLDKIVDINMVGYFKIRDEKTPSAYWYKKTNTWHDFGSGEGGDSIDLVMTVDKCSFKEACQKLSRFS